MFVFVIDRKPLVSGRPATVRQRRLMAEGVSKLEITRFSGVALPFPRCREADTERSGGATFAVDVEVARFYTVSAGNGHRYPGLGSTTA